jgi:hypothetical protein
MGRQSPLRVSYEQQHVNKYGRAADFLAAGYATSRSAPPSARAAAVLGRWAQGWTQRSVALRLR